MTEKKEQNQEHIKAEHPEQTHPNVVIHEETTEIRNSFSIRGGGVLIVVITIDLVLLGTYLVKLIIW